MINGCTGVLINARITVITSEQQTIIEQSNYKIIGIMEYEYFNKLNYITKILAFN